MLDVLILCDFAFILKVYALVTFDATLTRALRFAFVTHNDVCTSFEGDTLLTIQAPSGTQLEVPLPDTVCSISIAGLDEFGLDLRCFLSSECLRVIQSPEI